MDIDTEYYKIFYYVARYRSFTKAAEALYANQPNVTRTIKKLESELGCTLFVRSNRSVSLTPEGEKLFAHIKIAFGHIKAGEEELSPEKRMQGIVSVGATENTLHYVLLPVLKEFRGKYPDISLRVTNHNTVQALNALKNGLVDIAVVTSPVHLSSELQAVKVKSLNEAAVCSREYAALEGRRMTVKELSEYPLISLGAETMTFEFYSRFFIENGAVLSPDIEVATTDQILAMVQSGLGIGFVPDYFLRNCAEGELITIDLTPALPERSIYLIKRSGQPLSAAAKKLEEMILCGSDV